MSMCHAIDHGSLAAGGGHAAGHTSTCCWQCMKAQWEVLSGKALSKLCALLDAYTSCMQVAAMHQVAFHPPMSTCHAIDHGSLAAGGGHAAGYTSTCCWQCMKAQWEVLSGKALSKLCALLDALLDAYTSCMQVAAMHQVAMHPPISTCDALDHASLSAGGTRLMRPRRATYLPCIPPLHSWSTYLHPIPPFWHTDLHPWHTYFPGTHTSHASRLSSMQGCMFCFVLRRPEIREQLLHIDLGPRLMMQDITQTLLTLTTSAYSAALAASAACMHAVNQVFGASDASTWFHHQSPSITRADQQGEIPGFQTRRGSHHKA
jgi:hypothetical protein